MSKPTTTPIATKRHDIVIVGAGPSAMGLVFGLLSPFDRRFSKYNNSTKDPPFTIAIIERGPFSFINDNHSKTNNDTKKDPSMWFKTSHDAKSRDFMLLRSVPQRGMNGRMLQVPIGGGLGGGSNINACLAVPPSIDDFDSWPEQWTQLCTVRGANSKNCTTSNDRSRLPRIMASIAHIEQTLLDNNALYKPNKEFRVISQFQNDMKDTCSKTYSYKRSDFIQICLPKDNNDIQFDHSFHVQPMRFTARKNDNDASNPSTFLRVNYYQGLLEPLLKANPHLKKCISFYTHTEAQKLIIEPFNRNTDRHMKHDADPWIARGVQCLHSDEKDNSKTPLYIMAHKMVFLCAGAILSPVLLMMSGIGPKEELIEAGIEPLGDPTSWVGVGKNLQDHLVMLLGYTTLLKLFQDKTVNALRGYIGADIISNEQYNNVRNVAKGSIPNVKTRVMFHIMDGTNFHTMIPSFVAYFFHRKIQMRSQVISRIINSFLQFVSFGIQWTLSIIMSIYPLGTFIDFISAQILIGFLNMKSRGEITLAKRVNHTAYDCNKSIFEQMDIIVHPNYLSDERDVDHIEDTWQALKHLIVPNVFKTRMMEIVPGGFFKSPTTFARNLSFPFYHWMGTCTMETTDGSNRHYVVDKNLKVRNIQSLYICDSSVIPSSGLSAPPSLTLAALGYTAVSLMNVDINQYKVKKV
jgi:choline dehydrogenase-like flavoprotein